MHIDILNPKVGAAIGFLLGVAIFIGCPYLIPSCSAISQDTYHFDQGYRWFNYTVNGLNPPVDVSYTVNAPTFSDSGCWMDGTCFSETHTNEWAYVIIQINNSRGLLLDEGFNDNYDVNPVQHYRIYGYPPYTISVYQQLTVLDLKLAGSKRIV